MKVDVTRRVRFSAAHSYENIPRDALNGDPIPGLTKSGYVHGHNYIVDLTCSGKVNPRHGMVVNITDVDRILKNVITPLHETFFEKDHPGVAWGIPTTENLALWIWEQCEGRIPDSELKSIRVQENEHLWSTYTGDTERMVYVTRSYEFAAAHRLHSPELSDEENLQIFGKCNNPNGHGHNYILEVTVKAPVDVRTGMSCDIGHIDSVVNGHVVDRFDHKHLNLDVPEFENINPTSENIAVVVWDLLKDPLNGLLHKVVIRETERNYFEYAGEE